MFGGRKIGEPGEKPSEQGDNQQQTQPTYITGPESNQGHIGDRLALSSLRYSCSPTGNSQSALHNATCIIELRPEVLLEGLLQIFCPQAS